MGLGGEDARRWERIFVAERLIEWEEIVDGVYRENACIEESLSEKRE